MKRLQRRTALLCQGLFLSLVCVEGATCAEKVEVRRAEPVTVLPAEPVAPGETSPREASPPTPIAPKFGASSSLDVTSRQKIKLSLEAGVLADDNVFLSARNPVSDVLYHFSPALTLTLGDKDDPESSYLSAHYQPEAFLFQNRHEENTVDHTASVAGRQQWARLGVQGRAAYQRTSGSTVELGGRVPRDIWQAAVGFTYGWGAKTSFTTEAVLLATTYHREGFMNSREWKHENFLKYQATEKTLVGIGGDWGKLEVDEEPRAQNFQQFLILLQYQAAGKLTLAARAGVEWRQTAAEHATTPVFGLEAAYQPRDYTRVTLRGVREVIASGDLQGQNYIRTGLEGGLEQKIGNPFTLSLQLGWDTYEYRAASAGLTSQREDDTYFIRPAFLYDFADHWRAELWYQWRSVNSNFADQTYKTQQIGLRLRYHF